MIANFSAMLREVKSSLSSMMGFCQEQNTLAEANARLSLLQAHCRELMAEIEEAEARV